ncbi:MULTISPECIES: DNA glycosylase AlkZ-like family protein [unclassified Frankia]|uniref:DNA glycosylase AlkZ-like family protein n=1 Tax=unclassified Frankia TaxID=2632575 RepID=UPI002AD27458|nr:MULTISPECIES: crosslink repair DNA glycosylase YcaQ family protein [unclassified Frankia]
MSAVAPRTSGAVTLTRSQARQLWNWTLSRHGLHPERRLSSVAEIAGAGLGIHAARLPSPFATVLARAASPDVALALLTRQQGLTTLRCMRKTLHLLPVDLAGVAHAATVHYRVRDAGRLALNAGIPQSILTSLTGQLTLLLANGPLLYRQLEATLTGPRASVAAVRVAVKLAWERGLLTYLNQSGCWNAEHRAFALTSDAHPDLDTALDPRAATRTLVHAYFTRYGPATLKDATWWSALSRAAVIAALDASDTEWLQITTPWSQAPAYLAAAQYEEFLAADPDSHATGLNLLAHEDVALKGYFETRDRYLMGLPPQQAFNQIGEALPTIILDGQIQGTWTWNPGTRTVTPAFTRGRASHALTRRVSAATDTLTDALRTGWRDPTPAPAHRSPNQLALAI